MNTSAELADPFGLKGRVAVVTGSTKGLGEVTARILARAGAHVIISSRNEAECEQVTARFREQGLSVEALACHIGRMEDIARMFAHLRARHGGLDILVNNAVLSPWRTIAETDVALFGKTVDVNLRGYWYMSTEAAKQMKPRGGGSIVNIGSVAAVHPERMLGLYSTLKTALIGMSRVFALEYGVDRIRTNCVLPGVIESKLAKAFDAQTRERLLAKLPLGHLGTPNDVGYAVLYLCSPAAAYVTGTTLIIDGGLTLSSF